MSIVEKKENKEEKPPRGEWKCQYPSGCWAGRFPKCGMHYCSRHHFDDHGGDC